MVTLLAGEEHRYMDRQDLHEGEDAGAPGAHDHNYVVDALGLLHVVHTQSCRTNAPKIEVARSYAAGAWRFVEGEPYRSDTGMWVPSEAAQDAPHGRGRDRWPAQGLADEPGRSCPPSAA